MEKIDILNGIISAEKENGEIKNTPIEDLTGEDVAKYDAMINFANSKDFQYSFISINPTEPVSRVVLFLVDGGFNEYDYENMSDADKLVFDEFLTLSIFQ